MLNRNGTTAVYRNNLVKFLWYAAPFVIEPSATTAIHVETTGTTATHSEIVATTAAVPLTTTTGSGTNSKLM